MAVDMSLIALLWVLSYYLRFTVFEAPLGIPPKILYFKLIPFILGIWWLCFHFTGNYRRAAVSNRRKLLEIVDILQASALATLCLIAFTYFYEEYRYSRLTILVFAVLVPVSLFIARVFLRQVMTLYHYRLPSRNILLICCQDTFAKALEIMSQGAIGRSEIRRLICIDGWHEARPDANAEFDIPLVDSVPDDWTHYLTKHQIQSAVIYIANSQYQFLDQHLDRIADQVADVRIVPDLIRYTRFDAGIDMVGKTPVIHLHDSPLSGVNVAIKRLFDIIGSSILLLLAAPIMLLIALLIPFSSPGPILYRQERMGLDGKRFSCLKFRSMPVGSENSSGAVWATPDDGRATRLGSLLRRSSLDELPQLINVLKGDMSLVGPRPERPVFVEEFRNKVPGYMLRHKVKTGITGWAQVNGWRGSTSIHKRIECDLYYIQHWSIWLDIKILFLTIEEVFTGRNAY